MSMSKKDFIALAEAVREPLARVRRLQNLQHAELAEAAVLDTIDELADFCARQNPRFKRDRWLDYIHNKCGPNGGKR